jgi:predicted transcriptional regulator
MHVPKSFLIGLGLAFLVGVFAAAAQASVAKQYDDSPLTVPISRVGDEVTYASFEKGRPAAPAAPTGKPAIYNNLPVLRVAGSGGSPAPTRDPDVWSDPVYAGSKVGPAQKAPDRTGEVHDVVLVTSNGTARTASTLVEYVDLGTRLTIRSDWMTERLGAGSRTESVSARFEIGRPQLRGLELQGRTLRLGQDVSDAYVLPDWIDPMVDKVDVSSIVESRAFVSNYDTYGIRTEIQFQENGKSQSHGAALFGDAFRLLLVEDSYVSEKVPYPILIHRYVTWIHDQDVQSYQEMESLVQYHEGARPVAWGTDVADAHFRDSNTDIERSHGSQTYPEGGTGERLRYPLSEAVAAVNNDARLVQFQIWRSQHDGNRLVGAELEHASIKDDPGSLRWYLMFATPDGSASVVTSERNSLSGVAVNRQFSEAKVTPFDVADMPSNPITLGAADLLWSSMVTKDVGSNAPNRVVWGWGRVTAVTNKISQLHVLSIGYAAQQDLSMLKVDTETGNVLGFFEVRTDFECGDCVVSVSASAPPRVVPNTVVAGVSPPSVTTTAVATTGFMAIFTAVYFLPLVQFFGAQVFAVFPGFAKLRHDSILDNKLRDAILTLVKSEPGIHASDIARRVEAGWGTIVYHLSVLEKSKMVSSLVDGRHKRFFPVGLVDFSRRGQVAVLRNEKTKHIFEMIAQDPGIIQGDIAGKIELSVPAAIWHLKRLEDAGLVGRAKEGRRVHYYANKEEDIPQPYDERDAMEVA